MLDIDLGPAITALFFIFVVIPAVVGLVLGYAFGKLINKKNKSKKLRYVLAIAGMILLPIFWTSFVYFQDRYVDDLNRRNLEVYRTKIVNEYRIIAFEMMQNSVDMKVEVPRDGVYNIYVYSYFDKEAELINRMNSQDYKLNAGSNIINIPVVAISEYSDFVVEIENTDQNYNFEQKQSLYRKGSTSKPISEGVVYYSPVIQNKIPDCPVFNYSEHPCMPSESLNLR